METTKTSHFTCQSKFFISLFFTCQVSAYALHPFSCHDLTSDKYSQAAKTVFSHNMDERGPTLTTNDLHFWIPLVTPCNTFLTPSNSLFSYSPCSLVLLFPVPLLPCSLFSLFPCSQCPPRSPCPPVPLLPCYPCSPCSSFPPVPPPVPLFPLFQSQSQFNTVKIHQVFWYNIKYRLFQKFVPIINCILRKAFNASLGKCKLIQVRNVSK